MQVLEKLQQSLTAETVSQALYTAALKEQVAALAVSLTMAVSSDESKAILEDRIKQANAAIKVATDSRMSKTRLIDDFKKVFMAAEKQLLDPLNLELNKAKAAVTKYNQELYKIAQERQRKIDEELAASLRRMSNPENIAKKEALAQVQKQAVALPTGVKKVWVYKVADLAKVPVAYMQINEAAVKAAIAAGVRDIPGLVIEQDIQRTGR
jgi:hypothetical protein